MSDLIDRQALLKQIDIDSDGEPGYYGDTWKFIDTIKNMPNVHDLPKDTDTISRKGAIDALRKMQTYKLFSGDDMLLIDQAGAQTELMMLPPAQPAPDQNGDLWITVPDIDKVTRIFVQESKSKFCRIFYEEQPERIKGHWIHVGGTRYRCNKCGEIARKGNFCPNCGAEMEVTT